MSEASAAIQNPPAAEAAGRNNGQGRVSELKVSAHLMTLDTGVFCVLQAVSGAAANERSGLPGVRISLPPGASSRPDQVSISTFQNDGWLNGNDAAALIRVAKGPAQVLVTVYQSPAATPDSAPRLQVMRLGADMARDLRPVAAMPAQGGVSLLSTEDADVVVHVQRSGDMPAKIGDWAGMRGSRMWIEGFSLTPRDGIKPADIEYQAVLGRGWLSPWIEGGKFCGSRGMSLPLLGMKVRLKGNVAKTHECSYSATFVDGSAVGPMPAGETCEAESLAALEAFQVVIRRIGAGTGEAPSRGGRGRAAAPAEPPARPAERASPAKPASRPAKRPAPPRRSR